MTILRATKWVNNADLIGDVHRLGYLRDEWRTADVTYGKGNFWSAYRPPLLTVHDLALDGVDFRALPEPDESFDVVVLDAPFIGVGGVETSTVPAFQQAYGIDQKSKRPDAVVALIAGGLREARRVLVPGGLVLCKCMNYVEGGQYRTVAYNAFEAARGLGFVLVDEFVALRSPGPQPNACRKCKGTGGAHVRSTATQFPDTTIAVEGCPKCGGTGILRQQHTRANYSILFVFRRGAEPPIWR